MQVGDKVIIKDDKINSYFYEGNVAPLFERNGEIEFEIINIYKCKKFVDLRYKFFAESRLKFFQFSDKKYDSQFFEEKRYNVYVVPIEVLSKERKQ